MSLDPLDPAASGHGGDWEAMVRRHGLTNAPPLRFDFSVNLNPFGMPPAVEALLAGGQVEWGRYPEPHAGAAAAALARAHGLAPEQVLLGNGSTELIALVLRVLAPGKVTWVEPCYTGYAEACRALGFRGSPLGRAREEDGFRLDPGAYPWEPGALVFLASPNNPTGAILDPHALRRTARAHSDTWFVLDESYLDLAEGAASAAGPGAKMPDNLVVIKSLTKTFALPGLRLGMLAAAPALAARLRRALLPWSLNAAAVAVAPCLYSEAAFLAESRRRIREGRESLAGALSDLPGLKVFPSAANFLYLKLPAPWTGERLQAALLRRGMMIRAYGGAASPEGAFCRVAVRLPEENAELVRAMAELLGGPASAGAAEPKSSAPSRARALMVLGTMSNSGKSTVAAALCRCAARRGQRVAPFKAQNMALNSHVTPEGGEIGRAQAVQARAAGVESHADMNPVLLKPTSAGLMQVIVDGKAVGNFSAREYYARKGEFRRKAREAFDRLAARHDTIILEGAGSPAEINLRDEDFVNASMAEYAGARCVLVADIDRGGVFAAILGTVRLLPRRHRELLTGIIINKFRGDSSLLSPGLAEIERLTGVPVLGVLPYLEDLDWEEEDSLGLEARARAASAPSPIDIAVVRLPYLSNYTDFRPLERPSGVSVRYVAKADQVGNPDFLILPGSKNVRHDMEHLRRTGLARVLVAAVERSIPLLGICGGYQMLGRSLRDPHGLEGEPGETLGLGLLPLDTVLEREKELSRVEARNLALPFLPEDVVLSGYEIHLGRTTATGPGRPLLQALCRNTGETGEPSGFRSPDLPVFGCYLHGLFDGPGVAEALVQWLARRKGLDWSAPVAGREASPSAVFDRLADMLERHLDLERLLPPAPGKGRNES